MKDQRTKFFFWMGVLALPVFWSWFTLRRSFSRWERFAAFAWLAITVGLLAADWSAAQEFGSLVAYGYTIVLGLLTMALWGWLAYRIHIRITWIEALLLFFILGGAPLNTLLFSFEKSVDLPFSWAWVIAPLIPAVLHLLLDPTKALFQKCCGIRPA